MLLAGHLVSRPVPAGRFLSRKWREGNDAPPPPSAWGTLPVLTNPDLDAFFRALDQRGALVGVVPPCPPRYDGPVYVLTSRTTASAAEPRVHLLQSSGRATVVGERTAGEMVSSRRVALSDGWMSCTRSPTTTRAEGTRLEGEGVAPDVNVPASRALEEAVALASQ